MRIVSLLASGTEIVCALGAGEALVGRSHECDNPEWVRRLPSCTRPAFDINVSSREIDAEVRRRLRTGEPLYHVGAELIAQLAPDILITQEHCEVCAPTPHDVARAGPVSAAQQIVALSAGSVRGIYDGVATIGAAIGEAGAAAVLVADMQRRIDAVTEAVKTKLAPSVVLFEWTDPIFAMGNWAPELVEAANGKVLLGEKGQHSRAIPWDQVLEADPDFLIVAPCGFDLPRSLREILTMEALPGWFNLRAVQTGRVFFADGNRFFNRSGTTIVETVEILAAILHDLVTSQSGEGTAWERYPNSKDVSARAVA